MEPCVVKRLKGKSGPQEARLVKGLTLPWRERGLSGPAGIEMMHKQESQI